MSNVLARATGFAHLAGLARSARAEEETDDDKKKREEEQARASRAENDGETDEDKKKREDEEQARASRAENDGETDEEKKKREDEEQARASEAEDDDEEEMRGNSAAAHARRRERARCAAIFGAPEAGRNVQLAATLAFTTKMTRKEAIAVLKSAPAAAAAPNADRRASRNPQLGPTGESQAGGPQAIAASWDSAMKRVRPRT